MPHYIHGNSYLDCFREKVYETKSKDMPRKKDHVCFIVFIFVVKTSESAFYLHNNLRTIYWKLVVRSISEGRRIHKRTKINKKFLYFTVFNNSKIFS